MAQNQLVLLEDNRDVSRRAYEAAIGLRSEISGWVDGRAAYIAEHQLDPRFGLPDSGWDPAERKQFPIAYRTIRDGGYDTLNRLRFYTQAFSGYQLMNLRSAAGTTTPTSIPPDYDAQMRAKHLGPDSWVGCWIDHTRRVPARLRFSPPQMLGEIGWAADGIVVNHDTYFYQERVNLLQAAGILDQKPRRILEIGGGYGALALAIRRVLPRCEYTICDLPEALLFSGLYLTLTESERVYTGGRKWWQKPGVTLFPNYRFAQLTGPFDLVINTLSMSEMSEHQVRTYCEGIKRLIGSDGAFFEQNTDNRPSMIYAKEIIRDYFSESREITTENAAMISGRAHIWTNQ
jgi:hypothetical protein